jgi:hypothetical protein
MHPQADSFFASRDKYQYFNIIEFKDQGRPNNILRLYKFSILYRQACNSNFFID